MKSNLLGGASKPPILPKEPEPDVKPVTLQPVKAGRNLAVIGLDSVGKTTMSLLWGYLNSRYKERMGDDLTLTKKALSLGVVPEVEKIIVIETQNKLVKNMGIIGSVENRLISPLKADGTKIEIIEVPCKRLKEVIVGNKVIPENLDELQETADKFVSEVDKCIKLGPEYLLIIDNISDYLEMLDDKQAVLYSYITRASMIEKTPTDKAASLVEAAGILQQMNQSAWKYRNKWWKDLLVNKKKFMGWNIDIIAQYKTPDHFLYDKDGNRRKNAKELNTCAAPRSFEHIDHQFYLSRQYNTTSKKDEFIVEMSGKYMNPVQELNTFTLEPFRRFAGLRMFERIAHWMLVEDSQISD